MRATDAFDRIEEGENDIFENVPLRSQKQINKIKLPSQPVARSRITSQDSLTRNIKKVEKA